MEKPTPEAAVKNGKFFPDRRSDYYSTRFYFKEEIMTIRIIIVAATLEVKE